VTDDEWAVSPDGRNLALLDADQSYRIRLIMLKNGETKTLDQYGKGLSWSGDSARLYYWLRREPLAVAAEGIRSFDVKTGQITSLIDKANLQAAFAQTGTDVPDEGYYATMRIAVSPKGTQVLLWDSRLWLITILGS
jgi:hypothetical protein